MAHPLNAIVDPYDDDRALLQEFDEPARQAIEKLGEDLSERLSYLGDSQFALILSHRRPDGSTQAFRKFACTDAGNVTQGVCYFLRYQGHLPPQAVKVAAQNLWRAAEDFDVPVPDSLKEAAGGELVDTDNLVHITDQDFTKEASVAPKVEGVHDMIDWWRQNKRLLTPWEKRAFAIRLVRDSGGNDDLPVELKKYASSDYARDVKDMVLIRYLHLEPQGETEAAYEKVANLQQSYSALLDRRGSLHPLEFAQRLFALDKEAGLSETNRVPDAVYSTFGFPKQAEDDIVYDRQGIRLTEEDLKRLAQRGLANVEKQFGQRVATGFQSKPLTVFRSMPDPEKLMFARLASEFMDDRPVG